MHAAVSITYVTHAISRDLVTRNKVAHVRISRDLVTRDKVAHVLNKQGDRYSHVSCRIRKYRTVLWLLHIVS